MDLDGIIARHPKVALVDELAHTNVPGSKNGKRWQDVRALLDEGINVITTVNVQHLESLNDVIQQNLGVTVRETVPDWLVASADQVINLDISAEDLQERLREGKIYPAEKVQAALANFFTEENLTTLRELALREVASTVDRAREGIVRREEGRAPAKTVDRMLVAMSSDPARTAALVRRASRIAGRLNSDWYCVYVQTRGEQRRPDRHRGAAQARRQHPARAEPRRRSGQARGRGRRAGDHPVRAGEGHLARRPRADAPVRGGSACARAR